MRPRAAFTLIELLVVVAVVAILAAIALPNFLEAQTRAKVSAAISNQRVVVVALEAYRVDANAYPPVQNIIPEDPLALIADCQLHGLTSPVAYIASAAFKDTFGGPTVYTSLQKIPGTNPGLVPPDDFLPNPRQSLLYYYYPYYAERLMSPELLRQRVAILSIGPDRADSLGAFSRLPDPLFNSLFSYAGLASAMSTIYDPTNGSVSSGDIVRFAGEGG